jgi:hypothetical protein
MTPRRIAEKVFNEEDTFAVAGWPFRPSDSLGQPELTGNEKRDQLTLARQVNSLRQV